MHTTIQIWNSMSLRIYVGIELTHCLALEVLPKKSAINVRSDAFRINQTEISLRNPTWAFPFFLAVIRLCG